MMSEKLSEMPGSSPRFYTFLGYALILVLFGGFGSWAAIAKIDSAIIASGIIDVKSNRKTVQHLEGGIVAEILVKEGDVVRANEILVRLNDVKAQSNLRIYSDRLHIAQAAEARLQAERNLKPKVLFPKKLVNSPNSRIKSAINDQTNIFNDRSDVLNSQINILNSRIEQLHRQTQGLNDQKDAYRDRVKILREQLERLRAGVKKGVIQINLLSAREEVFVEVRANVGRMETELAKVEKSIGEAKFQILQTQQQYRERASTEYKDISSQIQEIIELIKIAEDVLSRLTIRASVDGTVQNLKVHTTGGVVRAGEPMMEIVPGNDQLVINAQISPIDIDNVHPGMETEIRFVAFQSRYLPVLIGSVKNVSKDVITPSDGRTLPYFLAQIDIVESMIPEKIKGRLTAGMPVDVVIKLGERTVLDYLIAPLKDALNKGFREE